ncbi:hypothetical protein C4N9_20470 [Pararhodobacter marinus]|uniref:Bacteriophage tail tape measure C-terminal domain-containing protein n=1 Tax=Pararhodobacter marinus TaxID=2184063 RepID=A0A2U2C447_9RHOB|nr:hypothetical protein [Pararhodobacter marinus]PWE26643.1 hypothetical protein C4N9_20470 [Pararhodobacter marinus]
MSGFVGRLRATLGLDSAEFSNKLRGARQESQGFAASIAQGMRGITGPILGASAALGTLTAGAIIVRNTMRDVAQIGDEARRAGLPVEEFQEWTYVASQARIPVDAMIDGFKEMSLRGDEFAVTGGGAAAEAFERLGFSAEEVARRLQDPSDMMLEIIRRARSLDRAARIRVFDELLGGAGGERFVALIDEGAGAITETMQRARDLGLVLEQNVITRATIVNEKFNELNDRARTFFQTMAVTVFAGGIETSVDALENMFGTLERARAILGDDLFESLTVSPEDVDRIEEARDSLTEIAIAYAEVQNAITDARPELDYFLTALRQSGEIGAEQVLRNLVAELDSLEARWADHTISAEDFRTETERLATRIQALIGDFEDMDGVSLSGLIGRINTLTGAVSRLGERAAEARDALPGANPVRQAESFWDTEEERFSLSRFAPTTSPRPESAPRDIDFDLPPEPSGGGGSSSPEGYAGAVEDIRARTDALLAEAAALAEVAATGQDYGNAAEYAAVRAEMLAEAQAEGREVTPELRAEIDAMAQAYVAAGLRVEELTEALERQREAGERGASALTDVFMAAMDGADAGRAAIARLIMELARMQAMRAFQGLASSGGIFGSLLQALGLGLGKNARGTESWRGGLSLVGEEGPELINLPTGAQVTPALETARFAREAAQGGGAGRMHVSIGFDDTIGGFRASVLSDTGAMMAQGFQQMNKALPDRVREINRHPRRR